MYAVSHSCQPFDVPLSMPSVLANQSIEERANQVIADIQKLESTIEDLLKDSNAPAACSKFLNSLWEKYNETNSLIVTNCACHFICKLPKHILTELLQEYPLGFLRLLEYSNSLQSQVVIKYLTAFLDNWKEIFKNIFQSLAKEPKSAPEETVAGTYLSLLQKSFSNRRCKQWIKFCAKQLPEEDVSFFILVLKKTSRIFAFNVFMHTRPHNLTQVGLAPFIECLVQWNYPNLTKSVLERLLNKFYHQKLFDVFVDQFNQLTPRAGACLLDAMSSSKQEEILYKYQDNLPLMASWMDGLFHLSPNFFFRKVNIQTILRWVKKEELNEFFSILSLQNSQIGPYLLICLSENDCHDFIYSTSYTLRSKLLSGAIADASTGQLLRGIKDLSNSSLVYRMTVDMENPFIPVDPLFPLTLKNCFETLEQVASNKEMAINFGPFIARIPPVLIGVLALAPERRDVLLNLANFLTEEQLKFFITPFSVKTTGPAIEQIWSSLSPKQLFSILEALSANQLKSYIQLKTEILEKKYQEYLSKDKALQDDLDAIKKVDQITLAAYSKLEDQMRDLHVLVRLQQNMDCHCLLEFLQRTDLTEKIPEGTLIALQTTITNLNSKRVLFEGPHAIIQMQLNAIEPLIIDRDMEEEEDLTMILYAGFWTLVREGTLPYLGISEHSKLGITNPGQLNVFGIRSNEDLKHLGISPQAQHAVENLLQQVEELLKLPGEPTSQQIKEEETKSREAFEAIWELFIDICDDKIDPSDKNKVTVEKVVNRLNLMDKDPDQVKNVCLNLCQGLIKFEHLEGNEREILLKGIQELDNCVIDQPQSIYAISESLFQRGLLTLKGQFPLFCLKRYLLENVNLKQTWEKFHSLGYYSISKLVEKQIIQTPADVLRLEELAKKI